MHNISLKTLKDAVTSFVPENLTQQTVNMGAATEYYDCCMRYFCAQIDHL